MGYVGKDSYNKGLEKFTLELFDDSTYIYSIKVASTTNRYSKGTWKYLGENKISLERETQNLIIPLSIVELNRIESDLTSINVKINVLDNPINNYSYRAIVNGVLYNEINNNTALKKMLLIQSLLL